MLRKFVEHYHDTLSLKKFEAGWTPSHVYSEEDKLDNRLKPFGNLNKEEQKNYNQPAEEAMTAIFALGYRMERCGAPAAAAPAPDAGGMRSKGSRNVDPAHGYNPRPVDLTNINLNREMQELCEKLAENAHDLWALRMRNELDVNQDKGIHPCMIPFDMMTDRERKLDRDRSTELLKFLQHQGMKLTKGKKEGRQGMMMMEENVISSSNQQKSGYEDRFAFGFLQKLIHYVDQATIHMKALMPSKAITRRTSFKEVSADVSFFTKVVLPLVERFFGSHREYFLKSAVHPSDIVASPKEKEFVATLFCKMAWLIRIKLSCFGSDVQPAVRCLQVLLQAMDFASLVGHSQDFVRTSLQTFFASAADDLLQTASHMSKFHYAFSRGTTPKQSNSVNYVYGVLLKVLSSLFDHLGKHDFGDMVLVDDIQVRNGKKHDVFAISAQVACYSMLCSLIKLGTEAKDLGGNRRFMEDILIANRPLVGCCLAAFASAFPVAFLEPTLNPANPLCVLSKAEQHSLEAQEIMAHLTESMQSLDSIMQETAKYCQGGSGSEKQSHVVDVYLPMLCSYFSKWWPHCKDANSRKDALQQQTQSVEESTEDLKGSEVALIEGDGAGEKVEEAPKQVPVLTECVTGISASLLNSLLKNCLILIKRHVGDVSATWMDRLR